ncbi:hypothetical protein N431DRAFT_482208 [Stipitochalara longipes BDJ]|nr:hypothetical protein N431DRAFT_482208 [Stipitochalara longipes BDJ]
MDPLSVSASVAGLLTAAQQIYSLVGNVVAGRRKGSKEISDIKSSLKTLQSILLQLQVLLLGQTAVDRKRASMILVDEIIATLAACVMTFSDIHGCLKSIETDDQLDLLDSIRWATKTKEMTGYLQALEAQKTSLSLIVNILTCRSTYKAEKSANDLKALLAQILDSNALLASRMSVVEKNVAASTIKGKRTSTSRSSILSQNTIRSLGRNKDRSSGSDHSAQSHFSPSAFEKILERSWAYQRAAARGPRPFSLASSTQLTQSWSILSGFSLSQISNIGVQKLPIYENDLQNSEHYSFTEVQLHCSEEQTTLETPNSEPSDRLPLYWDFPAPPSPANTFQRRLFRRGGKKGQKSLDLSPSFLPGSLDLMFSNQNDEDEAACYTDILKEPLMSPKEGYIALEVPPEHYPLDNSDTESVETVSTIRTASKPHITKYTTSLYAFSEPPAGTLEGYPFLAYAEFENFEFIAKNRELLLVQSQKDISGKVGWVKSLDFTRPTKYDSQVNTGRSDFNEFRDDSHTLRTQGYTFEQIQEGWPLS